MVIPNVAIKKIVLYFLVLLTQVCTFNVFAQIKANVETKESTCSSNGSIQLNVSGGTAPYIYEMKESPEGVKRNPQSNSLFDYLPGGRYLFIIKDAQGSYLNVDVNLLGNYNEPVLDCSVNDNTTTANLFVRYGKAPFLYSMSLDNGKNWSAKQSDSNFECIRNGPVAFRVEDGCSNLYTCYNEIDASLSFNYYCSLNSVSGTNISFQLNSNADYPLTYYVTNNIGESFQNNTGFFSGISGCSFTLKIKDNCGRIVEKKNVSCLQNFSLKLEIDCINFIDGTASLKVIGGFPPYVYTESKSGETSSNGNFVGLKSNTKLQFSVKDACGLSTSLTIEPANYITSFNACPFDGEIKIIQENFNYFDQNDCTKGCFYNFYPLTIECIDCIPKKSFVYNSIRPLGTNTMFSYPKEGNINIQITDQCNNQKVLNVNQKKQAVIINSIGDYCKNGKWEVEAIPASGNTFRFYSLEYGTEEINTSGIFYPPSSQITYYVEALNEFCDPDNMRLFLNDYLSFNVTCDSVGIITCPKFDNLQYNLYLAENEIDIISTSSIPSFSNLKSRTTYKVSTKNPITGRTINGKFTTDSLPKEYIGDNITCSSFDIVPKYNRPYKDQHNHPITYSLYDENNNLLKVQQENSFNNLTKGMYNFKVSHPTCGESQGTVKIDFNPFVNICISPYSENKSFIWLVNVSTNQEEITLKNIKTNEEFNFQSNNNKFNFTLKPGKYQIVFECYSKFIDLPQLNFNLIAKLTGRCNGYYNLDTSGFPTDDELRKIAENSNVIYCKQFVSKYLIFDNNWNIVPNTYQMLSNNTYHIVMFCQDAPLDSVQVNTPFYSPPELNATYGVICEGRPKGDILLTIKGGAPPYKYELLDANPVTFIKTRDSFAVFKNLDIGGYIFRVSDSCGISSDYGTSTGEFNFDAQFKRYCTGELELYVPNIYEAKYKWVNSKGEFIGDNYKIKNDQKEEDTYTVEIQLGNCRYSTTVTVPKQSQSEFIANAGIDFTTDKITSILTGNYISGTQQYWTQISPSTGKTTFNNTASPISEIRVSKFPGIYTYTWTVDGGINGCVSIDTVVVTFERDHCDNNDLKLNVSSTPSSCFQPNGSATAELTGGSGNFNYYWSNGNNTANIENILPGRYSILVKDDLNCSPDLVEYIDVLGNEFISSNKNINICFGEVYTIGDKTYNTSGTYMDTLEAIIGCDTINTTVLNVKPLLQESIILSECVPYDFHGQILTQSGKYIATILSNDGCDSIVNLDFISKSNHYIDTTNLFICTIPYLFGGQILTESGTYKANIPAPNGCDSIFVLNLDIVDEFFTDLNDTICKGESYFFNNQYLLEEGKYQMNIKSKENCDSTVILNLKVLDPPKYDLEAEYTLCKNDSIVISIPNIIGTNIYWNGQLSPHDFIIKEKGTYELKLMNQCGDWEKNIDVTFCEECDIYIPQAFSPNNDGINDTFKPLYFCEIESFKMRIFNRWGNLVFESNQIENNWKGMYNGSEASPENYIWEIEYKFFSENSFRKKVGNVILLR